MWKLLLLLGTTFADDLLAKVSIGNKPCVCGQPCTMSGGGSGVCQVNGECAVNIQAPQCNGPSVNVGISGTLSAAPQNCPMLRCAAPPDCPKPMLETPKLANGCPGCPRCRDTITSASTSTGVSLGVGDITAKPPCPVFKCMAPNCPVSQQETPKDSNGCSQCPRCKSISIDLDLDIKAASPNCPLIKCVAPNCPLAQQQTPKNSDGCKLCPICKIGSITSSPPCPVVDCLPPSCPVSQQETPTDDNGCSLCPKCKGVSTVPPVLSAGGKAKGKAGIDVNGDITAVVCPQLACLALDCPEAQQMPTKGANGCAGCPKCRSITAKGKQTGKGKNGKAASCATILCATNTHCVNGKCVPLDPCMTVKCSAGFHCENGKCVADDVNPPNDPCAVVRCMSGFKCVNGKCVADTITQPGSSCALILCLANTKCENGKCVPINPDSSCAAVTCLTGSACVNGRCVPNTLSGGR